MVALPRAIPPSLPLRALAICAVQIGMSSTRGFAQKIWLVAALANAGCAPPPHATPATPVAFTCPTFPHEL
jgi:hypothetical protein